MTSWISWARSAAESAIVLLAQRLVHLLLHEAAELVCVDVVVGELRPDLVDDELVDAQAQLLELRRRASSPAAVCRSCQREYCCVMVATSCSLSAPAASARLGWRLGLGFCRSRIRG